MSIPNKKVNFFSIRRSGHHAVMFWYLRKYDLDLSPASPNSHHYCSLDRKSICFYNNCHGAENSWLDYANLEKLDRNPSLLVRNYEDKEIQNLNFNGEQIIIMRDVLNLISTRYKKLEKLIEIRKNRYTQKEIVDKFVNFSIQEVPFIIKLWKKHYETVTKNPQIKLILYNKWLISKEYREQISNLLNVTKNIDDIDYVPMHGTGSSFIGQKLDKVQNYLSRYKQVKLPKKITSLLLNDEILLQINKEIFELDIKNALM